MKMEVYVKEVGGRKFLILGRHAIPMDRIKSVNLDAPNGGCNNSVQIFTDDPEETNYLWAYENADVVRDFFTKKED